MNRIKGVLRAFALASGISSACAASAGEVYSQAGQSERESQLVQGCESLRQQFVDSSEKYGDAVRKQLASPSPRGFEVKESFGDGLFLPGAFEVLQNKELGCIIGYAVDSGTPLLIGAYDLDVIGDASEFVSTGADFFHKYNLYFAP